MRLSAVLKYANEQPRFFVYAILDADDRPVYVGATTNPERRYKQHRVDRIYQRPLRDWVAANRHSFNVLDTFSTKRSMLDAEREYITHIKPQFNAR